MNLRTLLFGIGLLSICAGCTPLTNTLQYAASGGEPYLFPAPGPHASAIEGRVMAEGRPLAGAVVVAAEAVGIPYVTRTDVQGRYRLEGLPAGQYLPIAVAPGYEHAMPQNEWGLPGVVPLRARDVAHAPEITLQRMHVPDLPDEAAAAYRLRELGSRMAFSPFPEGAAAWVRHWSFERDGVVNDSLHVYLPPVASDWRAPYPLLLAIYPGTTLMWEAVSIAFASRGYAVVALAPLASYGRAVDEHGTDARLALHFARNGDLGTAIDATHPLAISGSYGSAALNRLVRMEPDELRGVAVLGGISNAFRGAAAFYTGSLVWHSELAYALTLLGTANLEPESFMEYSPVYTAEVMPPTLLLHTEHDEMVPIQQSYEYAAALRRAGVPVTTYYFDDDSHYIKVGAQTSIMTRRVFLQILNFLQRQRAEANAEPDLQAASVTLAARERWERILAAAVELEEKDS